MQKTRNYSYSSYCEYIIPKANKLVDAKFALSMTGRDEFIRYHQLENNDKCLEMEENNFRLTDMEAQKIIYDISQCKNAAQFQRLGLEDRDKYLHKLKETGLSIRQISRLTGISFGVVRSK